MPRPVVGATRHRAVKRALAAVIENEFPVREFQDAIDGFGDAGARVLADNNAVYDDEKFLRNNLALGFREVGERVGHAVGHRAGEPLRQEHRRKFVEARLCPARFVPAIVISDARRKTAACSLAAILRFLL